MVTKEDNSESPKTASKNSLSEVQPVHTYAAQCETCLKWRVIATQQEYEEIRSKNLENPFTCEKKPGVTCEDSADIECNATRIWMADRPGIPKTPEGFRRSLVLRRDFSKMDTYYITPTGKKLRTKSEIASFLDANPKYKDVSIEDFSFTSPKVMVNTIPEYRKKVDASGSQNRKSETLKDVA